MDAVAFAEKVAACSGMKVRKPVSRTSKPGSPRNKWAPGHRYQGATTKAAAEDPEPQRRADELVDDKSTTGALADYLAPATWGHTRAGRAAHVGDTIGADVGFNLRNPLTATTLSSIGGGVAGALGGAGLASAFNAGPDGSMLSTVGGGALGSALGHVLSTYMRRRNMSDINSQLKDHLAAGRPMKSRPPQYGVLSSLLFPQSGGFRAGEADAHEAIRDGSGYPQTTGRNLAYTGEEVLSRAGRLAGPVGGLISTPLTIARGLTQNFSARDRMSPKQAFAEKVAAGPSAFTGNLGGVFQGPEGRGLVGPDLSGGAKPAAGLAPTPKPQLTPPSPMAAPKMPQMDIPAPNPAAMPGGTATPGSAGPTVAQKPIDVSAPGMMGRSHVAPSLTAQFDMERAKQMGMHADGMPIPTGPTEPQLNQRPQLVNGQMPQPLPPEPLVKANAASTWAEQVAKDVRGKHRTRTLEEYDAKPSEFAARLAQAGS